jgi:hypothetical protein
MSVARTGSHRWVDQSPPAQSADPQAATHDRPVVPVGGRKRCLIRRRRRERSGG